MEFPAATGTAASGDDTVRAGVVKITGTSTETQQQQTVVSDSSRVNSEFPILRILNFLGLEQRGCYPGFLGKHRKTTLPRVTTQIGIPEKLESPKNWNSMIPEFPKNWNSRIPKKLEFPEFSNSTGLEFRIPNSNECS
jgi:hypothetical protein